MYDYSKVMDINTVLEEIYITIMFHFTVICFSKSTKTVQTVLGILIYFLMLNNYFNYLLR